MPNKDASKDAANKKSWYVRNRGKSIARVTAWRKANPGRHLLARTQRLERAAGRMKPENCDVCGNGGVIVWDHNHGTGAFRGWLCSPCNLTLGHSQDNPTKLRALADYLDNPLTQTPGT